jgi:2-polyprenyl-3-methyl-5-hydroxy-6-metoxy-1,4-benzoquinol methylase
VAAQDGRLGAPRVSTKAELLELQRTLYESRNPTRRWLHCTRRDWIIERLTQLAAGRRGAALEVGPGSGVYVPLLARLFERVTVSDVQHAYLDAARVLAAGHPNVTVAQDDIRRTTLPAGSFDVVLCTEVIEHIVESRVALAGMRRLLRPGGVLVLSTPQRYSPLEICAKIAFLPGVIGLVRRVYREPTLPTGHVNLMTAGEVRRQLEDAGFEIRESHTSGLYIPALAEAGGEPGRRLAAWLERGLQGGPLDWLLWTQYYVAVAGAGAAGARD